MTTQKDILPKIVVKSKYGDQKFSGSWYRGKHCNFIPNKKNLKNNENFVLGVDVFYNNIRDYIYLNPTGGVIDELPVYNYDQIDSKLFGGEIQLSYQTGIDWLSFNTSIEYLNGETSDGDYLPMIAPLTFRQDFTIDLNDNIFELDFLYK